MSNREARSAAHTSRLRAFLERLVSPGFGYCRRCNRPWRFVEPHVVDYEVTEHGSRGAFALCESCWGAEDAHGRIGYMAVAHGERDYWPALQEATLHAR